MFESCYVSVFFDLLNRVRPSSHLYLYFPHNSYILSHLSCDTSLPEPPTATVDHTHLIRNSIINPLLVCSRLQFDFSVQPSQKNVRFSPL